MQSVARPILPVRCLVIGAVVCWASTVRHLACLPSFENIAVEPLLLPAQSPIVSAPMAPFVLPFVRLAASPLTALSAFLSLVTLPPALSGALLTTPSAYEWWRSFSARFDLGVATVVFALSLLGLQVSTMASCLPAVLHHGVAPQPSRTQMWTLLWLLCASEPVAATPWSESPARSISTRSTPVQYYFGV